MGTIHIAVQVYGPSANRHGIRSAKSVHVRLVDWDAAVAQIDDNTDRSASMIADEVAQKILAALRERKIDGLTNLDWREPVE